VITMASSAVDSEIRAAQARYVEQFPTFDPMLMPFSEARRRSAAAAVFWNDGTPELARVECLEIPGPAGPLRSRYYAAAGVNEDVGAILYLHGGGWMSGSIDSHDRMMRCLAREAGVPVIGVDYRLAPEHPFPAALDDCRAAWRWLHESASSLQINADRIAIAGDSSGANLSLSICLAARDAGEALPAALALFYGCYAPSFDTDSYNTLGNGRYGLTTQRMRWYWNNYLGGGTQDPPVLAAPLLGDLHDLPPCFLGFCELDPLADDTRKLAERLTVAKNPFVLECWPGAVHGLMQMTRDVALARAAVSATANFLRSHVAGSCHSGGQ
jgi:acetyl esterase